MTVIFIFYSDKEEYENVKLIVEYTKKDHKIGH